MNAPRELVDVGTLERGSYLGGGDIAAIMGVSPYRTQLDVFLQKTGQAPASSHPDPELERRWRRGKLMEPVVVEMLRQDYGIEVVAQNHRYVDPEFPFLAAEIDFEWRIGDGPVSNGEIKTVHPFAAGKWGEAGTEEVPIEYAAQSMFGLMITERELCQYGTLFGSDNLALYHVLRDEETIANMRALAVAFWQDHVLARVPPAPRTADDLRRLWPKPLRNAVEASGEIVAMLAEHKALGEEIRVRTERRDELSFQIGAFAIGQSTAAGKEGDAAALKIAITLAGKPLATYSTQSRELLDGKALKAAQPDVYERYAHTTQYRVLRHASRKE